jgi:hypothetical protein
LLLVLFVKSTLAQNPLVMDQFTADPTARVFEGKIYLYPSHDILAVEGRGRVGWFCMEDYHVFSSENLTDWIDHGVIVSQNKVEWVDSTTFSMCAPDCMYRNGKYYCYFPASSKEKGMRHGGIGVAISDKPYGSFKPEPKPIAGIGGIDPNIFVDKDGQAYIITAMGRISIAKLKENMLEIDDKPMTIEGLPEKGLKEGPFMFERNGIYYLTYPHVQNKTEQLEYAISNNPRGPFKVTGVIMDESPECWTNHQSIVEYKGQWYLFYHHNDLSPNFDKNRSMRADSLFFNEDGTIKKVIPTLRGIGITDASKKIQIDRYSLKSDKGASIAFLDTLKRFDGWKTILDGANAWIQYNGVDFGSKSIKSVTIRTASKTGGSIDILLDKVDGPLLAQIKIGITADWNLLKSRLKNIPSGIHNIVVMLKGNTNVDIDWISFE